MPTNRRLRASFLGAAAALLLGAAGCAGRRPAPPAPLAPRAARLQGAYDAIGRGEMKEALRLLDEVIEEDPSDPRLRLQRGYVRQALGELPAAEDEFRAALRAPGPHQAQAQAALDELAKESAPEAVAARRDALLNQGYEALRAKDVERARARFRDALEMDPARADVKKQLAYMSLQQGDAAAAARDFEGIRTLDPQDGLAALELGYVYARLRNDAKADEQFTAALRSPDARVRDAAAAALKNLRAADQRVYLDVYAAPYYTSRFADKIAFGEAALGWKPRRSWPVSWYLAARYTQDSRSRTGLEPEIFSDNALAFGPGVRVQPPGWNAKLTAEVDVARNLIRSEEHPDLWEPDARVVADDYRYWEAWRVPVFADAGVSGGYYQRYRDNLVGYLQLRGGVKAWDTPALRADLYAPFNVVKDANKDFFNNLAEAGLGLELQPLSWPNLRLRGELIRGWYMGIEGRDRNPYPRRYDDARVTLIFSGRFLRPEPAPRSDAGPPGPRPFRW